jgi:hypothetical protein
MAEESICAARTGFEIGRHFSDGQSRRIPSNN